MEKNVLDTQIGGSHYKGYKYEPIKFIMDMKFDFIQGCILKYLVRYRKKNGLEDLRKAKHFAEIGSSYCTKVIASQDTYDEVNKTRKVEVFTSQEQFDKPTQYFLMIAITLIRNYQMEELAHLIDMQMTVEYAIHQH